MGTWAKVGTSTASATTAYNYTDDSGNVLFSLKGIKILTLDENKDCINVDGNIVTITNDAFFNTSTTSITINSNESAYSFKFADDVATTNTFKVGSTTYPGIPGAIFHSDTKTYEISTAKQLTALASYVNGGKNCSGITFKLTDDITLTEDWTAIGSSSSKYFAGTFDGNNHKISDLSINNKTAGYQGLFGYVSGATIQDVTLENVSISSTNTTGYVGALVGYATGGIITNCDLSGNVQVEGKKYERLMIVMSLIAEMIYYQSQQVLPQQVPVVLAV